MGIGNSKSNAVEGEGLPAKIRPMLVSRYEEFRKRRNRETTLSKKNLLNEKDDNSQSSHRTEEENKVSSSKEIEPPKEETVERVITAEKLSRVVPVPNSECENVEETHPNKDNIEQVIKYMDPSQDVFNRAVEMAEAEVKTEEEKTAELVEETKEEKKQKVDAKGDDHHEDSGDEDESEKVGRFLCPGSPSFRIYCIEAEKRNEEECEY